MRTVDEIQKWASIRYPSINFDFSECHIDTIKPTIAQFDKLAQQYPEVTSRLKYLGVNRPNHWTGKLEEAFATASFNGKEISINPKYYGNPSEFKKALDECLDENWLDADGSIESVMSHEFGHMVENWLLSSNQSLLPTIPVDGFGEIRTIVQQFNQKFKPSEKLSRYATTTNDPDASYSKESFERKAEGWAEGFAAIQHKPRSKWPAYVKQLDNLLKNIANPDEWYADFEITAGLSREQRRAANEAANELRKKLGL